MIQRVFYGETNALTARGIDARGYEKWILALLVVIILAVGVYPQPLIRLTEDSVNLLLSKMFTRPT